MNGKRLMFLLALLCATLTLCFFTAHAEGQTVESEWTVLFYMCGSDLESKYSYATKNLEDIVSCVYPTTAVNDVLEEYMPLIDGKQAFHDEHVNVLIETGGCKAWHAEESLGMKISTKFLQRWRYEGYLNDDQPDGFSLKMTLPLQSMARPQTLADFIRWGAKNYPAKKYALVLWDHGSGSKTGLFIDELFDGDVMYLDELGAALRDSGVHLEAVVFDACLMAGLETAYAISDSAEWMIASEEQVAGKGSAVRNWLQQLFIAPTFNGEWLGRWICDMTQIKYANEDEKQSLDLLTWSVIDLDKIPKLVEFMDTGYESIGKVYAENPKLMSEIAKSMLSIEHYGTDDGNEKMWDVAGLLYSPMISALIPSETYKMFLEAMRDAVVYDVRGPGRSAARGLSYCYAVNFTAKELDGYARNCPMPHYLAFLDAITPWIAPDWVYEKAERLPEMNTLEAYDVTATKLILEDNTPALAFDKDNYLGAGSVHFNVRASSEWPGEFISYGTHPAYFDVEIGENGAYHAVEPWFWPALEGQFVASYVVDLVQPGAKQYLGSIPVQIESKKWYLRYGYFLEDRRYAVYGLWNGYDSDSGLFDRNVKSLSEMVGQEYALVYALHTDDLDHPAEYVLGEPQMILRNMHVENRPVQPGTYYFQYVVYDMFMRPMPLEWVQIEWDGEKATLSDPEGWKGEKKLKVPDNYWE